MYKYKWPGGVEFDAWQMGEVGDPDACAGRGVSPRREGALSGTPPGVTPVFLRQAVDGGTLGRRVCAGVRRTFRWACARPNHDACRIRREVAAMGASGASAHLRGMRVRSALALPSPACAAIATCSLLSVSLTSPAAAVLCLRCGH